MIREPIVAETKEELLKLIEDYAGRYHPSGYGTSFSFRGELKGERGKSGLTYVATMYHQGPYDLSDVPAQEDGTFVVTASRFESCD